MKIKLNYFVIPLLTAVVIVLGKYVSQGGMQWYGTLVLPELTPPRWVFPIAWNLIYLLTTIAVLLVWNRFKRNVSFWVIIGLFLANAFVNVAWTWMFFGNQKVCTTIWISIAILLSLVWLIYFIGVRSFKIALLLVPYLVWISFALYLNIEICKLNYAPTLKDITYYLFTGKKPD